MNRGLAFRDKLVVTMDCDESDEPPRLAKAGGARWMRRNVVINGLEPWAILVRYGITAPLIDVFRCTGGELSDSDSME